jgi:RsiW-degrading membrane proteinase PrsW (M82 family)
MLATLALAADGDGSPILGLILIGAVIALYFLPTIVASNRSHQSRGSILVINLFLGWTLLGWVLSLAWACGKIEKTAEQ